MECRSDLEHVLLGWGSRLLGEFSDSTLPTWGLPWTLSAEGLSLGLKGASLEDGATAECERGRPGAAWAGQRPGAGWVGNHMGAGGLHLPLALAASL